MQGITIGTVRDGRLVQRVYLCTEELCERVSAELEGDPGVISTAEMLLGEDDARAAIEMLNPIVLES